MNREIIVNGLRYHVSTKIDPSKPSHWKGFGGRKWTIRFFDDGELIRTDDMMWDYTFKTGSKKDTAVILEGWSVTKDSPICGWQRAGEYNVFGPVR